MTVLLILTTLATVLTGCGDKLPPDAKAATLETFDAIDEPRIHTAKHVEPLAEDIEAGAEEVWCVNLTYLCWGPPYTFEEHSTCADNRLVRLIDGEWQVSILVTDEDEANWEARGCELILDHIAMP
jgi:predicted small lipoprotein YifL